MKELPVKTSQNPTRLIAAAIVALALGVGGYLTFETMGGASQAPNVGYTLLDGSKSTTDQLRGKVVLVNFWATDCTTCVHEMPQIVATHEKYKARGYETLAVAMSYDPPAYVINFAETRKLPFGVAIDNTGAIAKSFGQVQLTPTSVLINKRGEIVKRYVGEPDFVALHQLVEKLLAET
jgi:peroxiredoxin